MKAPMTPEREREYNELLGFVSLFSTAVNQIDPTSAVHPANTIKGIVERFGKSKALVGLRQAANDCVEYAGNWNPEARVLVDETFRAAGVVTLSEITRRHSASYKRIVKRGFIKNETEYHVINGILIDHGNAVLAEERMRLQKLTQAFEKEA